MKKNWLIIFIFILFQSNLFAEENKFFSKGKNFFEVKKYDEAKFQFEKDIVFNPKSEKSYLYLAKIYNKKELIDLEENNLNTVLLLNPKNEEAIYLLTLLNIKKSNFSKAKELIKKMDLVCSELCSSKTELESKLNSSLKGK